MKFQDLVAHRVRQQGEVIRAGTGNGGAVAEGRAARRRPALLRPRRRDRGAQGHFALGRAGRVRRHHRPERLRQEHAAVADLRHPQADRRRGAGRRQAGRRAEPQGRLHAAAGLPVRVAHHPGERGARRRNPGRRHGQGARARDAAAHPLRARPVPAPSAAPALGRHAPARGAGAHALHRAGRRAARRAVLGARFADPARARRRGHRNPAPRGQDRDPGHARHRRGGQHGGAGRSCCRAGRDG